MSKKRDRTVADHIWLDESPIKQRAPRNVRIVKPFRPRYLPQPSREEIVGEALAELHRKLTPFRRQS